MSISAYEEAHRYAAQQQQHDSVEQLLCVDFLYLFSRTQPALLSSSQMTLWAQAFRRSMYLQHQMLI